MSERREFPKISETIVHSTAMRAAEPLRSQIWNRSAHIDDRMILVSPHCSGLALDQNGSPNEQDHCCCRADTAVSVVVRVGARARGQHSAWSTIRCCSAWADRCCSRCLSRLHCRPVDRPLVGNKGAQTPSGIVKAFKASAHHPRIFKTRNAQVANCRSTPGRTGSIHAGYKSNPSRKSSNISR
jgi:hypothetical protein